MSIQEKKVPYYDKTRQVLLLRPSSQKTSRINYSTLFYEF